MALSGCGASFLLGSNTVGSLNSISNPLTGETLDVTTFDSGCMKEFIAGLRSGSITISGFYDPDDTTGQIALGAAWLAGTVLTSTQLPKILWDGTNGISCDAIVTQYSIDTTVADTVKFSCIMQLTGTPTFI